MTPAEQFESYRPLLFSIAYRMLGSVMEAEDILQDAYVRYQAVLPEEVQSPRALLSTIVTRLCLNQLESAQARRETYLGPWLPEPLAQDSQLPGMRASLNESISMAFLVLLESLTPTERAVFLLREIFDYDYAEIAQIVGKDEAACRQLFSRARKHIAENRPRFSVTAEAHREMLDRFQRAVGAGDLDGLMALLAEDVTMWADGGGKARGAAIYPLHGREAVARFVLASVRLLEGAFTASIITVNGEPALVIRAAGQTLLAAFAVIDARGIRELRVIGNPDKLKSV